jgi:hypothetical protein
MHRATIDIGALTYRFASQLGEQTKMDALFASVASALGASVDQIKVRPRTFYVLAANARLACFPRIPCNWIHVSHLAHFLSTHRLPTWKRFHSRTVFEPLASAFVQYRRRYLFLFRLALI